VHKHARPWKEIAAVAVPNKMVLKPAIADDAHRLNELTRRSVLHWGYEPAFLDWEPESITVDHAFLERTHTVLLEVNGELIGYYALTTDADATMLDKLFVEPRHIGNGYGKALWNQACADARLRGAARIRLYSDPNAAAFYAAMGAQQLEIIPTSWPGWSLQLFEFDLA
jgi:GNAT superfamily N-acetyltransferase